MPYAHSLDRFVEPGFYLEPPESWTRRLREISPVVSNMDHLGFRYFDAHPSWNYPDRGQWVLYSRKPIALATKELAVLYEKHWSELPERSPTQPEVQEGRKAVVSDYQHFMWHSQGLYVKPFLILQGEWGGTPAQYTPNECAFLEASDCFAEPFPLGMFPACPFDERTVEMITLRDRMLKVSNSYGALEALDDRAMRKSEDEAANQLKRRVFLDTWSAINAPSVEFMQSYLKKSVAAQTLPDAPEGLADTLAHWKDDYVETGIMPNVQPASQKHVQVAVA